MTRLVESTRVWVGNINHEPIQLPLKEFRHTTDPVTNTPLLVFTDLLKNEYPYDPRTTLVYMSHQIRNLSQRTDRSTTDIPPDKDKYQIFLPTGKKIKDQNYLSQIKFYPTFSNQRLDSYLKNQPLTAICPKEISFTFADQLIARGFKTVRNNHFSQHELLGTTLFKVQDSQPNLTDLPTLICLIENNTRQTTTYCYTKENANIQFATYSSQNIACEYLPINQPTDLVKPQ